MPTVIWLPRMPLQAIAGGLRSSFESLSNCGRRMLRHWLARIVRNHGRIAASLRSLPRLRQAFKVASCTASCAS